LEENRKVPLFIEIELTPEAGTPGVVPSVMSKQPVVCPRQVPVEARLEAVRACVLVTAPVEVLKVSPGIAAKALKMLP
jgi:hypothetical protein